LGAALATVLASLAPATRLRAADPQPYTVTIAKTGNAALDGAINDSSTLVSLRANAPVGPFALVARARQDAARFVQVLGGFGYYAGTADVRIAGRGLDDPGLPDFLDAAPAQPPVAVTVALTEGKLFHLRHVGIDGTVPPAARDALGLAPGAPAVAADVLAAQGRLRTALQNDGYALAQVDAPVATLVPSEDALDVAFPVRPGPRVDIGPISLSGLQRVNPGYVERRLLVHTGDLYSAKNVEAARQDLADVGVFSAVRVRLPDHVDAEGRIPLGFDFTERPPRAVSVTLGYSTDLGANALASWKHRNLFGNAEQLTLSLGFSLGGTAQRAPGYNATVQFIRPDLGARDQNLQVDATALKQSLEAYDQTAVLGDVLLTRKFGPHWSGSAGVAAEQETIRQEGVTRDYTLIGLPIAAKYDSTDNLFAPTSGIRAAASVTPTESLGHTNATFVLLQASGSTYFDLAAPGRTVLALRGLVGDAEGASQFELPPDKRFYAGGTATVRGFRYQSIGPRFADNRPQGGTSVAAGTVELRQRILSSYGVAAFVDAGQVAANGGPFSGQWRYGAGVGARYYTPIGPIRLDVAVPLNKQRKDDAFELYIGIGEAF
jgi:translocation and assembly module TamA